MSRQLPAFSAFLALAAACAGCPGQSEACPGSPQGRPGDQEARGRSCTLKPTILLAAVVGLLGAPARAPAQAERRPNIVIVMPDDIGYGDFACLGNPIIQTPRIDRLHDQSIRFTSFHVSPTCAPTRAALMTGRHEFKNGVTHTIYERERLAPDSVTLAQILKSAGYTTGIFGKWHLGDEPAYGPDKRGFDETFIHGAGGIGQTFPGSCGDAPGNTYFDPAILHNGRFEKTQGYCTDVFFTQALAWIDSVKERDKPFFAYITPNAAHEPLQVPESYAKRHAGQVPENVAKFYGMIENIDDNVGRLLDALDQSKLSDNTLVLFLTDNGGTAGVPIFNAGMRGKKVTPFEGGTRVPSFWRWPAGLPLTTRDIPALTAHIDILPTLAAIAGAPLDGPLATQVEGRSLAPLLKNPWPTEWPNRTLVTHVGRWPTGHQDAWQYRGASIRDDRWSLVFQPAGQALFDLQSDPGQATDAQKQHPEIVTRLRAAYDQWWADVQPRLVNETAVGPAINPFKALYYDQFGGAPDPALLDRMNPARRVQNEQREWQNAGLKPAAPAQVSPP
jgi:arylsulfatase